MEPNVYYVLKSGHLNRYKTPQGQFFLTTPHVSEAEHFISEWEAHRYNALCDNLWMVMRVTCTETYCPNPIRNHS